MRLLEVIVSSRIACSWSEATKMTSLKDENQRFKDTRLLCPNIGNPLRIPLEEYLLVAHQLSAYLLLYLLQYLPVSQHNAKSRSAAFKLQL